MDLQCRWSAGGLPSQNTAKPAVHCNIH
jgi:hypothetical protein